MSDDHHPLRGAFAAPPRQTWAWALPFTVALILVGVFAAWLQLNDAQEFEESRRTLISDALSLEQQLRSRHEFEQRRVNELAQAASEGALSPGNFAGAADVIAALRQGWLSVDWLDDAGRLVLHLPEGSPRSLASETERRGMSYHLEAIIPAAATRAAGRLIVRFSLTALLTESTPWWLARRYVVSLVDDFDQTIATTAQRGERADGELHRISFEPPMHGVLLELKQREAHRPWYRTYPLGLVGLVLGLLAWSTWLLRGQFRGVERAEAAWRGEAAWRRAMEDALTVGLRARDLDGRLIYANPRFHELTGYAPAELLGCDPPMPYWPPESIEATFDRFRRTIRGDAPREGYETRWRRKDGVQIDVMVFEAPLVDARGTQVGWMGSVIDVTERKRALERERLATERMAHQARLTLLGEIASSLAHQLNQPLMAIAGYNAGLRNMLETLPGVDARCLAALDKQAEQTTHAGRIVHRIREFLMRRAPQPEPCRLREVIDDTLALLQSDLQRRGIALEVTHADDAPEVRADPVLIGQVVVNLVRNAADTLTDAAGSKRIEIRTTFHPPAGARVEVRDHGPGLCGRGIEELTAPFYSTKADGMGLGLAICRSIIEAHAGRLEAADAPGGGACFRFTLPFVEASDGR